MRHRMAHRKLGRVTPHRIALLRNLATALFEQERIRTTLSKAKELRPFAEKLITLARRDDDRLHARRLVLRDIRNPQVVRKLFDTLGSRYATRPGGYTRILHLGPRRGDGAEMAVVELVDADLGKDKGDAKDAAAKGEGAKKKAAPAAKKPAAKKKAKPKAEAKADAGDKPAARKKTAKKAPAKGRTRKAKSEE